MKKELALRLTAWIETRNGISGERKEEVTAELLAYIDGYAQAVLDATNKD